MRQNIMFFSLHLKQSFPSIIWIFTEGEGDKNESRQPFKIFSTLRNTICIWFSFYLLFSKQHEERTHELGQPYSWEAVDNVAANYTPDITPLILAAHKNNYEILKILLDRGASLPSPHDLKCSCEACLTASQEDSLRFSLSRINAYRALASPSLISLTR